MESRRRGSLNCVRLWSMRACFEMQHTQYDGLPRPGLLTSSSLTVTVPSPHRFAEKQFFFEKRQTANRWGEGAKMLKALAFQGRRRVVCSTALEGHRTELSRL